MSAITELKNSLGWLKSRLDEAEYKLKGKFKDRSFDIIQSEEQNTKEKA